MDMIYLNDSNYIKFNIYDYMTKCTIGNSVLLHNNSFDNKYNSMTNLIHGDTPNNVTDMSYTYFNCRNLTGSPVCGPNVTSMFETYAHCINLTGSPVCGPNVTDMGDAYFNCTNLTGSPVCGNKVTSMDSTYYNCTNLTGNPVCGNNVKYIGGAYFNCTNLTGTPVCGTNVTSMGSAYYNCTKITGNPVCGNKVTDMSKTYWNCRNITGSPVCGTNVTNMSYTYAYLRNAKDPVCGPNVTNMYQTYYACSFKKETLTPVCGNNVIDMAWAYAETGKSYLFPVCGPNVTNMSYTYFNAYAAYGNMYMYSNNVSNMYMCFKVRNHDNRLNIYVTQNTTSFNTCIINNTSSMFSANVIWANNNGVCYYNTYYNTYIYPVENVTQSRLDNGDYENDTELEQALVDFTYEKDNDGYYHITGWKQTRNGVSSTECILPNNNRIVI